MYSTKFELKQHTPIIHFQHEQDGATLRASELKPKLDRFILKKLGNGDYKSGKEEARKKAWLIGDGKKGVLEYNVTISAKEVDTSLRNLFQARINGNNVACENPSGFFGNMTSINDFDEKKVKKSTFYKNISLEICTCFPLLKIYLEENFTEFLFIQNFGTRQSKGFGSFYIKDSVLGETDRNYFFKVDVDKQNFNSLFMNIDLFYRTIKSGINLKGRGGVDKIYVKSLLFHYAKNLPKSQQWDKRTIRHAIFFNNKEYKDDNSGKGVFYERTNPEGTVQYNTKKHENQKLYYDFRDLLGLSSEQDWRKYRDTLSKTVKSEKNNIEKNKIEEFEIDRFKSPITFKPIYNKTENLWYVYIVLSPIPDIYKKALVKVDSRKKHHGKVSLAMYPDMKIYEYMHFAINHFDEDDIILGASYDERRHHEFAIISDIFSQLKEQ